MTTLPVALRNSAKNWATSGAEAWTPPQGDDLLALDAALAKLAEQDPAKSRLVELRFFAGQTGDQASLILGISPKTADRYRVYARAWLRREMEGGDPVRISPKNQ